MTAWFGFLAMKKCHMRTHSLQETEVARFVDVCNRTRSISASEAEKHRITEQRNTARPFHCIASFKYWSVVKDGEPD